MEGWDIALLVIAAYVAVVTLVRLMLARRKQMLDQPRQEVAKEKGRKDAGEKAPTDRAA
jgi:hypothetical protein